MRRRQFNRLTGRGPGGRLGTSDGPVTLLSAAITADGLYLRLTFSRSVTLNGTLGDILLTGNYRSLVGDSTASTGSVFDVTMNESPIYSDETFTIDIGAGTFVDSSGNFLPAITGGTVTNGSAVAYLPSPLTTPRIAEMRAAGRLYVARTGTGTTATADSDLVGSFRCDQGILWTAPSDAARMILADMGGGKWSIVSDGVDDGYSCDAAISLIGDSVMVYEGSQSDGTTTGTTRVMNSITTNSLMTFNRAGGVNTFCGGVIRANELGTDVNPHTVMIAKASAGNWRLRLDSSDTDLASSANSNNWGRPAIGSAGFVAETFTGDFYGVAVLNFNADATARGRIAAVMGALS